MLSARRALAFTVLLAPPSLAQTVSITALAPMPEARATLSPRSDRDSIPTGPIATRTRLFASTSFSPLQRVSSELVIVPLQRGAAFTATNQVYSPSPVGLAVSGGVFRVDVDGPFRGDLRIVIDHLLQGLSRSEGRVVVDVDRDGQFEADLWASRSGSVTVDVPLVVTSKVSTHVYIVGHAAGRDTTAQAMSARTEAVLTLRPRDSITFLAEGDGCSGGRVPPALAGVDQRVRGGHVAELTLLHGLPNASVLFVFGARGAEFTLPQAPFCTLLVDPTQGLYSAVGSADATGRARLAVAVPAPLPALTLQAQALPFDTRPRVWTSNRLAVTLWP